MRRITPEHLSQIGAYLAKMHLAGAGFPHPRRNALSVDGWQALADQLDARIEQDFPGITALIDAALSRLSTAWPEGLPSGAVHADLFPDNVFFLRERGGWKLSGVIDWYFACTEMWAYDLAITINAWCFDSRYRLVPEHVAALMQAYTDVRPLTPEEEEAMPLLLQGAALRFLLTRAYDWLGTPEDATVTRKNPQEYIDKLTFFQNWRGL